MRAVVEIEGGMRWVVGLRRLASTATAEEIAAYAERRLPRDIVGPGRVVSVRVVG